ncbi:MAG: hypothetical protein QME58_04860 [Bacteroidota bacterium]|nr:hypothetical protein [Bacteroidota bacterium]
MKKNILFLICIGFFPFILFAQTTDEFKIHQVEFGLGGAKSFEKNPFNLTSGETDVSPDVAINFGYYYHHTEDIALCFRMYGFVASTPKYVVTTVDGRTLETEFDISLFNIGIGGKYIFSRGRIQPYGFLLLNLVSGTMESSSDKSLGTLNLIGFSFGGGAGVNYMISQNIGISIEATGSSGLANWKQKPFINSTGKDFNPSMLGILLNASYYFGN